MDDHTLSPEYITRFNQAYLIAKHKPELARQLAASLKDQPGFDAFKAGLNEYTQEQARNRHSWLSPERSLGENSLEKDMEQDGPDKD